MSDQQPGAGDLPGLTNENHRFLLDVAKDAVERHIMRIPQSVPEYSDPKLAKNWGAFVTLKINGELRGCIGNLQSDKPLPETIASMAVKSATTDPRFPPVNREELDKLEFDISILGPLQPVNEISEIVIGRDGLLVEMAGRHGLLLPQVATEHSLDVKSFLDQTCIKAGLPPESWRHGARIYRFAAEVFG